MAPAVSQGPGDGPKGVRAASKEWPLWPLPCGGPKSNLPEHRTGLLDLRGR